MCVCVYVFVCKDRKESKRERSISTYVKDYQMTLPYTLPKHMYLIHVWSKRKLHISFCVSFFYINTNRERYMCVCVCLIICKLTSPDMCINKFFYLSLCYIYLLIYLSNDTQIHEYSWKHVYLRNLWSKRKLCISFYTHTQTHPPTHTHTHRHTHIHTHIYIYIYTYKYISVCLYVYHFGM